MLLHRGLGGEALLGQGVPALQGLLRLQQARPCLFDAGILFGVLQLDQDLTLGDELAVGEPDPFHQLGSRRRQGDRLPPLGHAQQFDGVIEDVALNQGRRDGHAAPRTAGSARPPALGSGGAEAHPQASDHHHQPHNHQRADEEEVTSQQWGLRRSGTGACVKRDRDYGTQPSAIGLV